MQVVCEGATPALMPEPFQCPVSEPLRPITLAQSFGHVAHIEYGLEGRGTDMGLSIFDCELKHTYSLLFSWEGS